MTITERLSKYIKNKGLNPNKVTVEAGLSVGLIGKSIKNNRGLNSDTIEKILYTYTDLNPEWLVIGKGEMLKNETYKKIDSLEVSKKVSKKLDKTKSTKKLILSETPTEKESAGIPLIPIEAMAGWGTGEVQVMDYEMGLYKVPEFDNIKVDFMIRARGSSMYPKYNSGDTLACLKVELGVFFQWNKVYVLDTSQGAMVKRIKKSDKENHILCVSDNPNYDPFELPLEDLYAIALVVGVIRLE